MSENVFVTVGTTQFDDLIDYVVQKQTLQMFVKNGYKRLLLQIGNGSEPTMENVPGLTIDWYRLKPSIAEDFANASLVISHAGAGSCIEALETGKPLIAVVNNKLMGNHQTELAEALAAEGFCKWCYPTTLHSTLAELDLADLKPYRKGKPEKFAEYIDGMFQI